MTPAAFIAKWRAARLKERSASQEHFIDLCRLLGQPTPAEADPGGESYGFERGARKDSGGKGWADVWKRHCFAWEYKGKHADLDAAFNQLRQYALALENPPLLIVSDMERIRIRTNWTNSVSAAFDIELDDLADAAARDKLTWAMTEPEHLRPGITRQALTERAAATFARLAQSLRRRGHAPQIVAHFVNRLVFCMFAEDVGLLPRRMFTRMLEQAQRRPDESAEMARRLFAAMAAGGDVGFETVAWFNGGLFDDDAALPLEKPELDIALAAAALDWSEIDPSILGTLFERGLDPDKRQQLGAHYTDRDKIMKIVEPTVMRPFLTHWQEAKAEIAALLDKAAGARPATRARHRRRAEQLLAAFLERLRGFTVLDPACGSGNFLYLALHALKDLEHRVQLEAEAMGLPRRFPTIGPASVKGIELNAYAAELARVSVWIGEIQWMRRNGFQEARDPILKPLETIVCRDAILDAESGGEPPWPQADVVVGNPPFLGYSPMREALGDAYTDALRKLYKGSVPAFADLVCYWFHKAGKLVAEGKLARAGLVATNSIRGGRNRAVLDYIAEHGEIFDAWADEPWVIDGAAVRVSLVCFGPKDTGLPVRLNGEAVAQVNADLTAGSIDLTQASRLATNRPVAFLGVNKNGPFDVPGDLARQWLRLPANPNGRPNADVLKPRFIGMDLTRRPTGRWVIDFGISMSANEAALYEAPFAHVAQHVKPMRAKNRAKVLRDEWWRHEAPRPGMWRALTGLHRYIVTPRVAKHRLFVWLEAGVYPDHQLIVIARDDDTTFGILHSRFHEAWSLRLGSSLEDRPRYTPTTTFETFPFPAGLTPDIPATDYASNPHAAAIAQAARRLVELRNRWLNPPEWVQWQDEPAPGYPKRPTPRNQEAAQALKTRTLTTLYNTRPPWLQNAHTALDEAVAAAYGWDADIAEGEALEALLALNRQMTSP